MKLAGDAAIDLPGFSPAQLWRASSSKKTREGWKSHLPILLFSFWLENHAQTGTAIHRND